MAWFVLVLNVDVSVFLTLMELSLEHFGSLETSSRFCCCTGAEDASAVSEIPTLQAMPQRDPVTELTQERLCEDAEDLVSETSIVKHSTAVKHSRSICIKGR